MRSVRGPASSLFLALLAISAVAFASAEFAAITPLEALRRSMEGRTGVPYTLVLVQRFGERGDQMMQVKIQSDGKGRSRRTVLQPLSMQGIISVDDGKRWLTILPDENRAMRQESPATRKISPTGRIALVAKNYSLRFDKPGTVAGRPVIVVVAAPKDKDMLVRRYLLDKETLLMLRYEFLSADGRANVILDTQVVTFQPTFKPAIFSTECPPGMELTPARGPRELGDIASAKSELGFTPRVPSALPLGLQLESAQLLGGDREKLVALRLTDGLAVVTVYQLREGSRRTRHGPPIRADLEDAEGVKYSFVGDLSQNARKRLADSFLKRD